MLAFCLWLKRHEIFVDFKLASTFSVLFMICSHNFLWLFMNIFYVLCKSGNMYILKVYVRIFYIIVNVLVAANCFPNNHKS